MATIVKAALRTGNRFEDAVDFYRGVVVRLQAFSAVVAYFKRIEIAEFAFPAADTVAVVKHAFSVTEFVSFHMPHTSLVRTAHDGFRTEEIEKLFKKYEQTFAFYLPK